MRFSALRVAEILQYWSKVSKPDKHWFTKTSAFPVSDVAAACNQKPPPLGGFMIHEKPKIEDEVVLKLMAFGGDTLTTWEPMSGPATGVPPSQMKDEKGDSSVQVDEQPSPLKVLLSSHASPESRNRLPQVLGTARLCSKLTPDSPRA